MKGTTELRCLKEKGEIQLTYFSNCWQLSDGLDFANEVVTFLGMVIVPRMVII